MKPTERKDWINEQFITTARAIQLIESAKKERVSEHDIWLRKLGKLFDVLLIKSIDTQEELFDPEEILTPELKKRLADPTHGL